MFIRLFHLGLVVNSCRLEKHHRAYDPVLGAAYVSAMTYQ